MRSPLAAQTERIRLGMVGGGEGAFIGAVHRIAARLDDHYQLVAGALSSTSAKAVRSGKALGLDRSRIYSDYAEMARRELHHIACARGCTGCCEEPVVVYLPEAAIIAEWLRRPDNARARGAFLAAFERWRAAVGDAPEQLAALTGRDEDRPAYEALHRAQWRRRVPCAFLVAGDCAVYPVRPLVCRSANALGTSAHCVGDAEPFVPATRLTYRPVDDLLARASSLLRAVHNATSDRPNQSESVCVLVHRLLTAATAG